MFETLDRWHQTKKGLIIFAVVELLLALLFAYWAIDSGNLLEWFLAFVLLAGFVQNVVRLIWRLTTGAGKHE
jgi:hypothetical protein